MALLDNFKTTTRPQLQIDWASNPNIRPVCLPDADAGDYDQLTATVTGQHEHGYDEHDGDNCDADAAETRVNEGRWSRRQIKVYD